MAASNENLGILAMELYTPRRCVEQVELEVFDGVSTGKYTIGLGQDKLSFVGDREDIHSICLTVLKQLLERHNIDPCQVGRLEVGTETILDKSKSVKSVLMTLFAESGNTDIEGVDTTHACFGGTSALFNSLNWLESSSCNGRLAIVVAGDIAIYCEGPARPTGGVGAVAMLLGPNAPLVFDQGVRSLHIEHAYDFYKPDLASEYPYVDGHHSAACYSAALDTCYGRFRDKYQKKNGVRPTVDTFDYFLFHCPYTKLVIKSFARLLYDDFREASSGPKYEGVPIELAALPLTSTYTNKDLETMFVKLSAKEYSAKVAPGTALAKLTGNMYTASLYCCLISLLVEKTAVELLNKKLFLFSYGGGLASAVFSISVVGDVSGMVKGDIKGRLKSRTIVSPSAFNEVMKHRERTHAIVPYTCSDPIETLFPGTFFLVSVDEQYHRVYDRVPDDDGSASR